MDIKKQLQRYFGRYVHFTEDEFECIFEKLQVKTFAKKEFLLEKGQICRYKYFISKGLIRSFYIDEKGTEKITQFAIDNWWLTNMESFVREQPSTVYLQALEESIVYYIQKSELEYLYSKIPKLERLFRIITENMLIAQQRKSDIYLQMKSKDRYEDMVKHLPDFVQRIPQYMLASYLEITPEYLSELRKNRT